MVTERERNDAQRNQPVQRAKPVDPPSKLPDDKIATPPSSPPHLGGKQIQATVGPHAGSIMIIAEAEADQAIADKWATELNSPPIDHTADVQQPLTEAEMQAALDAANAWWQAQQPQPQEEGGGRMQITAPPTRNDEETRRNQAAKREPAPAAAPQAPRGDKPQ